MQSEQVEPREIGHRLRIWRARSGFNQKKVADLIETTQSTISRIENGGKPKKIIIHKLEELMSDKKWISNDVDIEIVHIIAESYELRDLIKRIARALGE